MTNRVSMFLITLCALPLVLLLRYNRMALAGPRMSEKKEEPAMAVMAD